MNRLNRSMLARQFNRVVGVLLFGLLMMVSVACGNPDIPTASVSDPSNSLIDSQSKLKPNAKLSDRVPPKPDAMNGYDDDTQGSSPKVKAKTRVLIDNAQRNIERSPTAEDLSKKAIKSAEDLKNNVIEGVEEQKGWFSKSAKNSIKNLKENLDKTS